MGLHYAGFFGIGVPENTADIENSCMCASLGEYISISAHLLHLSYSLYVRYFVLFIFLFYFQFYGPDFVMSVPANEASLYSPNHARWLFWVTGCVIMKCLCLCYYMSLNCPVTLSHFPSPDSGRIVMIFAGRIFT